MEELLKQIIAKGFKESSYSVYNFIEDDGFISELKVNFGKRYFPEDFEYIVFDLDVKDKNGIIYSMSKVMKKFIELKKFVEFESQDDKGKTKARLYIKKDKGNVFIVKLKEFDLMEIVRKKIGEKQEVNHQS